MQFGSIFRNFMDATVQSKSSTNASSPLQTKYYNTLDKKTLSMHTVMEMTAIKHERIKRLPLRYALLIDVSGSMNDRIGDEQTSLLQRVQNFAELAIGKVAGRDWLSIITFSDGANIVLPMQRMTTVNKQNAQRVIRNLCTENRTNLEKGMYQATEAFRKAPQTQSSCRDCILLFTDGLANAGETNPKKLIDKYLSWQSRLNRRSSIPISAFTIGGYQPELLIEISRRLGSESFYWLNEKEKFEVEMLIPLILREATNISDVNIELVARASCYFDPISSNEAYFKGIENSNLNIQQNEKMLPTTEKFFIHFLPDSLPKNLSFDVQLPEIEPLIKETIVDIYIRYLDCELKSQTIHDCLVLYTDSLDMSITDPLSRFSAFIIPRNHHFSESQEVEEVFIKGTAGKLRRITMIVIEKVRIMMTKQHDDDVISQMLAEALREIDGILSDVMSLLPDSRQFSSTINHIHQKWRKVIMDVKYILEENDDRNFCKLTAMVSSIATENPVPKGVFPGEQPFITPNVREELDKQEKKLEDIVGERVQTPMQAPIQPLVSPPAEPPFESQQMPTSLRPIIAAAAALAVAVALAPATPFIGFVVTAAAAFTFFNN